MKTKELILEASSNPKLKEDLIRDAKTVLKENCGISIDDDIELKVVFEDSKTKYLVIPFIEETANNHNILNEKGHGPCTTTRPTTHGTRC